MGVLRKRALLASISGADDNVDMGAMLTGFRAMAGTSLLPLVNASAGAYKDVVRGYQRDGELSDVSSCLFLLCLCVCKACGCSLAHPGEGLTNASCIVHCLAPVQGRLCLHRQPCINQGIVLNCTHVLCLQGTGMAVYFPSSSLSLDARYITLVASDSTSLNDWLTFLQGLYTATNLYTSTGSLGK